MTFIEIALIMTASVLLGYSFSRQSLALESHRRWKAGFEEGYAMGKRHADQLTPLEKMVREMEERS